MYRCVYRCLGFWRGVEGDKEMREGEKVKLGCVCREAGEDEGVSQSRRDLRLRRGTRHVFFHWREGKRSLGFFWGGGDVRKSGYGADWDLDFWERTMEVRDKAGQG